MNITCHHCAQDFTFERKGRGRTPKYCTPACRRRAGKANEKASTTPCSIEGCAHACRAKGLCVTHYNAQHQPDRHAKTPMTCTYCGGTVLKGKSTSSKRRIVCSDACRAALQWPPKCDLPEDHWALWYGTTSAWPRHPLTDCGGCGDLFAPDTHARTCCSDRCRRAKALLDTGRMPEAMMATVPRQCDTCGSTYASPYVGQTCCKTCKRKKKRSHWINDRRRIALYERDKYKCHICGDKANSKAHCLDAAYPTLDHLVPRSKGGSDEDYNLATCCRGCNTRRGVQELPMLQLA